MNTDTVPDNGPTRRRLLAASLCAAACGGRVGVASAAHMVRPWPADKPTPQLQLADLHGKTWDLSGFKGRPVLLNFWATWCEPCRAEMPSLDRLAAVHRPDGLAVLSVNYREALPTIKRFLEAMPVSLPILLDHDGSATDAWTPKVFPTTVLIDRAGIARQQVLGEIDWSGAVADDLLRPLLAKHKTG